MNVRDTMDASDKKRFAPKTRMVCECGKTMPPGPMKVHTNRTNHNAVVLE